MFIKLLRFIAEYGENHGLTTILNTILLEPEIQQKLSTSSSMFRQNYYKYFTVEYLNADFEYEASVLYESFMPKSLHFNLTMHENGVSTNVLDVHLRLEGVSENIYKMFMGQANFEQILQKLLANPKQFNDVLEKLASLVKFHLFNLILSYSLTNSNV